MSSQPSAYPESWFSNKLNGFSSHLILIFLVQETRLKSIPQHVTVSAVKGHDARIGSHSSIPSQILRHCALQNDRNEATPLQGH